MSFWNLFGSFAFIDQGETVTKMSDAFSVSSDGSTRMGNTATGLAAVFSDFDEWRHQINTKSSI